MRLVTCRPDVSDSKDSIDCSGTAPMMRAGRSRPTNTRSFMTSSPAQHRHTFFQRAAFAVAAALASVVLAACGVPEESAEEAAAVDHEALETNAEALTDTECRTYITSSGTGTLCHWNGSSYSKVTVNRTQCCSNHRSHSKDYLAAAASDPYCKGCVPKDKKCHSLVKCCSGLTCQSGYCKTAPTACSTAGQPCTIGGGQCCAGLACFSSQFGTTCG